MTSLGLYQAWRAAVSEGKLKVTDRRMFTPDGELKEEFRHLEEAPPQSSGVSGGDGESADVASDAADTEARSRETGSSKDRSSEARSPEVQPSETQPSEDQSSGTQSSERHPSEPDVFTQLVAMLAEPAALYLGDAQLPDGRSMEDPRMARLHIDLLATLQAKTQGNLDQRESDVLEDVLYQLRVRYLQKHGSR